MLERADALAARLRSFVRAVGALDVGVGTFDLVAVVAHAAGDAGRLHGVPTPHVYGLESPVPVAGAPRDAHTAVMRAVSAALAVVDPEDVSVVVSTRGADTATL